MRVIGLDISLSSTGFASLYVPSASHAVDPWFGPSYVLSSASIRTDPVGADLCALSERMSTIVESISIRIASADARPQLVVVEGPSMASIQGSHNLSGLWWRVVGRVVALGLPVVQVAPTSLKLYATGSGSGRGKTKVTKSMVVKAVTGRYDVGAIALTAKDNDRADAIVLAAIGARLLGRPIDRHIPAPNLRALTKICLPEGITAS